MSYICTKNTSIFTQTHINMSGYRESEIDKKNTGWFQNDKTRNTLQKIAIEQSAIRGLGKFEMEFNYPISVIVGENGCGKSTILALVSCAFHNNNAGFCPISLLSDAKKQRIYYTYSDFFAFTATESGFMRDIRIKSTFLTDKPKNYDVRRKSPGGKWIDYDSRPKRAVSFLGINRILPPSESITHRHYSSLFGTPSEINDLAQYMKKIFGKDYSTITMKKHHKYRLYECVRGPLSYTGFNMGAGENAVLQLLHEIISAGKGALIVVDEIELGLHIKAQHMLIQVIKELCFKYNSQIICSSHSATILNAIPPEGRIMIKSKADGFDILYGVSPEMAMSELSGLIHPELEIMVEDDVAKDYVNTILPHTLRRRVEIVIMGSADGSILQAIATHYREGNNNFIVVADGDKKTKKKKMIEKVVGFLGDSKAIAPDEIRKQLDKRLAFLPGKEWPEKVFIESLKSSDNLDNLLDAYNLDDVSDLKKYLTNALVAGKHSEFPQLAKDLCLEERVIRTFALQQYHTLNETEAQPILNAITNALP